jgi:hypothetical protein
MSTGSAAQFFTPSAAIPDGEVPPITRAVFKNPLPPGADQLAATKNETALMDGRARDAATAPASVRSKVNAPPVRSPTPAPPSLDAAIKRSQLGAARGQAADLNNAMSTFER